MKKITNFAAILMMSTMLQSQTTIYVTPNGSGNGTSWADAGSLENAISVVERSRNAETQIWVQKGTYYPSKMLIIQDSVKIYGGFTGTENNLSQRNFSANPTIVDGQQKIGSIFRLENSAEINGFTIQNGNANGNSHKNGGGIWADENTMIENCIIKNNTAMLNGGGVYANGKVKMINTTIEENIANGSGNNTFGNCLVIQTNESNISPNDIAGCYPHIPHFGEISFKSDQITTISANSVNQEWSDVVLASGCNKPVYQGGISEFYYSDCRANTDRSLYGDLFSWCAVARFGHILCPAPWRVPTVEDFVLLDQAMGGNGSDYTNTNIRNNYINTWRGSYGGACVADGTLSYQNQNAYCWALSAHNAENGFASAHYSTGRVFSQGAHRKYHGFMLRCVR